MKIIPAIDIINGKCVRLTKGDFSKQKIYNNDPVEVAKSFVDAGFDRLHLVDLDGAKAGDIKNLAVLEAIADATNLKIDFSGGIKNIDDVSTVFNAGASIITLGSFAVKSPGVVEEWVIEFGADKILIGADVLDNKIKVRGWLDDGEKNIYEFIAGMIALGAVNLFCTDISKDGAMEGPSFDLYKKILQQFPTLNLIASGGIDSIQDLDNLKVIGCCGSIIGKAIYEGKISLQQLASYN